MMVRLCSGMVRSGRCIGVSEVRVVGEGGGEFLGEGWSERESMDERAIG